MTQSIRRNSIFARRIATFAAAFALAATTANAQTSGANGDTVTTASGLRYVFLKHGSGAAPAPGDVMVMHGVGRFANGKEFWNTRKTNEPFEYVVGVSGVIRGFGEGMLLLHEGDRVMFIMKPELAYGAQGITGIPRNSTLVFDYEILGVHPLSITRLLREGVMNIDSTITAAKALPNLKDYYVSEERMLDDAAKLSWAAPRNKEKILKFGVSLLPNSHELSQALAKLRAK
ncbi:MAG: FKBP-type peptidyl-prolyl cis-trans isomerase [Gemmatimonadaceae bacterium]